LFHASYTYTNPLGLPNDAAEVDMREFTILIGQLFFIALLQTVLELFIDPKEKPKHVQILNIACIIGSLYLLLQFVFQYLMGEISTFVNFSF